VARGHGVDGGISSSEDGVGEEDMDPFEVIKMKDPDWRGLVLTVGTVLVMTAVAFALLAAELTAP